MLTENLITECIDGSVEAHAAEFEREIVISESFVLCGYPYKLIEREVMQGRLLPGIERWFRCLCTVLCYIDIYIMVRSAPVIIYGVLLP